VAVPQTAAARDSRLVVTVFDLSETPRKELATVHVGVGEDAVATKTSPAFSVRILEVRTE
jgi:hypothetical protein